MIIWFWINNTKIWLLIIIALRLYFKLAVVLFQWCWWQTNAVVSDEKYWRMHNHSIWTHEQLLNIVYIRCVLQNLVEIYLLIITALRLCFKLAVILFQWCWWHTYAVTNDWNFWWIYNDSIWKREQLPNNVYVCSVVQLLVLIYLLIITALRPCFKLAIILFHLRSCYAGDGKCWWIYNDSIWTRE